MNIPIEQLAAVAAWLLPFIKFGYEGFIKGVGEGFGEEFAKKMWNIIEKTRKIDPNQTKQVEQLPIKSFEMAKTLTLKVLQVNPSEAQQIEIQIRPALKKLLRNRDFFVDAEIREILVPNLDYTPEKLAGPNASTDTLVNKFIEQAVVDGKLEHLILEIQALKHQKIF